MAATLISAAVSVLRPHAPVAERVLLPGDPGRALRLAQQLLDAPKMLNHHRGLWGYTGAAADGAPMTVQSTGLGGPSTAIVVEELIALGARRLVRAGTCAALVEAEPGSLVIAESVRAEDGASRALGADGVMVADAALLAGLRVAGNGALVGPVVSADVLGGSWPGAVALDLSTAALFAVAARAGVAAASVLAVVDARMSPEAVEAAEVELGRVAAASFVG
jgi:uridine phosphorylase